MEFAHATDEMNFIESQFAGDPVINVIAKDDFNSRVDAVFHILYETLVKSFGPGGAGTFISIYPKYFNTKDGFTIMKNIAFDKKLDQVICDMVMDICSRLNFTVGDGTTSAVIATEAMYASYRNKADLFKRSNILPRHIISHLDEIKEHILDELNNRAIPIRSDDPETLKKNIWDVVWVSSNGNLELTSMIADLYYQLRMPAITCTLAKDGIMKSKIVDGYRIDTVLTDKIYINNDNNTMSLNGANVVIFDHRVTKDTYQKLIVPMVNESKARNKHLVCIAPYYDEVALSGVIRNDLLTEHKKTGDISLVLMACRAAKGDDKVRLEDLSMLLGTQLITPHLENLMISKLDKGDVSCSVFNFDNRGIEGLPCAFMTGPATLELRPYTANLPDGVDPAWYGHQYVLESFPIGYCDQLDLGLKESTLSGFHYKQEEYDKYLDHAKRELAEAQKKTETNGAFSFDLYKKQERVLSLGLKTGVIEVGATSEISQNYLKDMVDDAVKAAESAYLNGVVRGCNVTTLGILSDMITSGEYTDDLDKDLLLILFNGFRNVYASVINNVMDNVNLSGILGMSFSSTMNDATWTEDDVDALNRYMHAKTPFNKTEFAAKNFVDRGLGNFNTLFDAIIINSIKDDVVIDVANCGEFSKSVINSAETDREILKAVIDLLSLLITGNQLVMR